MWWHSPTVLNAARNGDTATVIRLARQARGETQRETGDACGYSQSEISRIENGKTRAYDIRLLTLLARHLNIPRQLLGLAATPAEPPEPPVNRREFLTGTAAFIATAALPRPVLTPAKDDIEALRTVTTTYRRMDGTVSARELAQPVIAHLRLTGGLLQRAADRGPRSWLAESVSETAGLAAWLSWDMADVSVATSYYEAAIKTAHAAGNKLLFSYMAGSLATLKLDSADPASQSLTALARQQLGARPAATANAWLACLEAQVHAAAGDPRTTWDTLDRAEAACERIPQQEPPPWPWVFPFDRTKIAAHRIRCAVRLGQPEQAFLAAEEAMRSTSHVRQHALLSFDLADAHMQANNIDEACRLASQALQDSAPFQS
jgi:transcriptional regulator with XRE-family HTH domain